MESKKEQQVDYNLYKAYEDQNDYNFVIYLLIILYYLGIPLSFVNHKFFILYSAFMFGLLLDCYMKPYLFIREGGKQIWIFEKFRFAPTTPSRLFQAKLLLLRSFARKHTLLFTLIHLCSSIIFHHKLNLSILSLIALNVLISSIKVTKIYYHSKRFLIP